MLYGHMITNYMQNTSIGIDFLADMQYMYSIMEKSYACHKTSCRN